MMMLLTIPLLILAGMLSWSFAEYGLHNWRGHHGKGKNRFSKEHLSHHADARYFAPTLHKLQAAGAVTLVMLPLSMWLFGWVGGAVYTLSFLATYAGYEFLHRRIHTHPPRNGYGRWARRHHLVHHFTRPTHNHGVTSPIWDFVFRTYQDPGVVRVPRKKAMVWLCDDSGEIKPEYAEDYVLVGRPRRTEPDQTASAPAMATAH